MYSTQTAYLLWLPSFLGVAGLHRLYMGKIGTGILFMLTGGLFGIGTIYDGLTMERQVREARLKSRVNKMLSEEHDDLALLEQRERMTRPNPARPTESLEHVILRVAKTNHGVASPAEVALEGNVGADEARTHLDTLVDKGFAEVRVRKSGVLTYVFPDFLDAQGESSLEQF